MSKYTGQSKISIIKQYLARFAGYEAIADRYGIQQLSRTHRRTMMINENKVDEPKVAEMSVMDLNELVKAFEEKFGVSAAEVQREVKSARAKDEAERKAHVDDEIKKVFFEYMSAQSLGLDPAALRLTRIVPVVVYLKDGANHAEILDALDSLLEAFEMEILDSDDPIISSFWKNLWARTTSKETVEELKQKLAKVEKAMETQHIAKPQSEIELNQANAVAVLLNAMQKESQSNVIFVGNILILSILDQNGCRHSRTLTLSLEQQQMLQQNPDLVLQPELLLGRLSAPPLLTGTK